MPSKLSEKPAVEVKDLKVYIPTRGRQARPIDGISFKIAPGETLALVGESGCGKTMTALSLIQLLPPGAYVKSGEILVNGADFVAMSEKSKREMRGASVSMIFQEPMTSLNPVFTVGEQILEGIRLHRKLSKAEARSAAIKMISDVGLPDPERIYGQYPHTLSGGQRQRIMIAIALACRPDLLIADEPTTALDVTIQSEILALLNDLKAGFNSAVLLITHNMALVYGNADRVAVMYAGKIVETAAVKELFEAPKHPYTANLLQAIPGMDKRGRALKTIPGAVPPADCYSDGCRFAGRCDREMIGCAGTEPALIELNAGHLAACHLNDSSFMAGPGSNPINRITENAPELQQGVKADDTIALQVRGLKTYYPVKKGLLRRTVGHVKAVDNIDLTIRKGSTLALVGESGCGKTTAGKSIIRLNEPDSGEIIFNNKDLLKLNSKELKKERAAMQMIFQDPYSSLNPRMRIKEIVEEGLRILRPDLDNRTRSNAALRALERVGLGADALQKYPHEFSGGQRQRIGIARALAVEPTLLICDEAVSSLDVSVQAQILNLLKSVQRQMGLSYLFITHDLGVVEYMADEVAVMYDGKIVERATTEAIFSAPVHEYTKRLLKAVPKMPATNFQEKKYPPYH